MSFVDLDWDAVRQALLPKVYSDKELDIDEDEDDEEHREFMRGQQILTFCTAEELQMLIRVGLVKNTEDFRSDSDRYGSYNESLLEFVMPDTEKMAVCIAEMGGTYECTSTQLFYSNGRREWMEFCVGPEDKLNVYLHKGGMDPSGIWLLATTSSEPSFVFEGHVESAKLLKLAPEAIEELEDLAYQTDSDSDQEPLPVEG